MRRYIEYFLLLVVTFYMAILFQSEAFLVVGYAELAAGVLMTVYLLYVSRKVSVQLVPSADVGEMGKMIPVDLQFTNRGRLPIGRIKVCIRDKYPLLGEKRTAVYYASVPAGGKTAGRTILQLGYIARHSGRLALQIKKAQMYDFLGLLALPLSRKRVDGEAVISIFPDRVQVPIVVQRSTLDYAQEKEEQAVRGERQPNESWQIRNYQPGDRLRDIHWKLTAKTEEIMVSDHITEIGCPVFLFMDYHETGREKLRWRKAIARGIESYLEVVMSLSSSMVENDCPHCIVWFDEEKQDVCRMEIRCEEDVYLFFQGLENLGSAPDGMTLEEWYEQKYRGAAGITRLIINEKLQCLRNGEVLAEYFGKNRRELLQSQELYV